MELFFFSSQTMVGYVAEYMVRKGLISQEDIRAYAGSTGRQGRQAGGGLGGALGLGDLANK